MRRAAATGRFPSDGVIEYLDHQMTIHGKSVRLLTKGRFFGSARKATMLVLLERFEEYIQRLNDEWAKTPDIEIQRAMCAAFLDGPRWTQSSQEQLLKRIGGKPAVAQVSVNKSFKALVDEDLVKRRRVKKFVSVALTPLGYLCAKWIRNN